MAFCQNCGARLEESYKFCNVCGTKVTAARLEPEILSEDSQEVELSSRPVEEPQDTSQQSPQPAQELWKAETSQPSAAEPWDAQQPQPSAEEPWQTQQPPIYPMGYGYPQPPKKSGKTGWIIALVIAAILICTAAVGAVAFWLFGGNEMITVDDPNLGTYVGTKATMWGVDVNLKDILADGFVIELKAGGICRVTGGGENGTGKWSLEGNVITINDGKTTLVGTLEDGVMEFENMMDLGLDIVFYKQDADKDQEIAATPVNADTDWWNGEWYGWWMTSSCEGDYESWEGAWWDCCAEITMDENGQGHLLLWEEDYSRDEPLAEINLVLTDDGGTMGTATTKGGYFMDQNVSYGDYVMDPSQDSYENLLSLKGWYETRDGGFFFEVYLRPWGQLWDDMIADDEGYAPYYYEQYVKAVENGESAPEDIHDAWGE